MSDTIKAYKVFNPDWTSKHGVTVFEVGKSYHQNGIIECCANGFHACASLADCFSYYDFNSRNKVAEVELSGVIDKGAEEDTKLCASDIKIIREITWDEVLKMCNTGNCNTGYSNAGNNNYGNGNTGSRNTGNCNSGDCNSCDRNTGEYNSGYRNSGYNNSGSHNAGNYNSGDCNSGNWNSGDFNSGFFNTKRTVFMFNKDTGKTLEEIDFPDFLHFDLTLWVPYDNATEKEMKEHKQDIETCGGFLKTLGYKEAFRLAWDRASEKEHEQVKHLPNFDPDIFYEISGIDVRKE